MLCACGGKDCKSVLVWDKGCHTIRAIWEFKKSGQKTVDVLLYYDANSLISLIREAKEALIRLTEEVEWRTG